jgi:hypothetical protein
MSDADDILAVLVAKDQIRELALLYARGVDRKDAALLRTLYTRDATDTHDATFDGSAEDYVRFLERAFPHMRYSGHHICNHLIAVDGDHGEGEVYAIAWHVIPDGRHGWQEDLMAVRYIDRYQRDQGCWRFAQRVVRYDFRIQRPLESPQPEAIAPATDPSYSALKSRLFARGVRA